LSQDSMGVAASFKRRWTEQQYEVWAGPLSGGRTVVALINLADVTQELTLDLPDVGFQTAATVTNVWAGTTTTNVVTAISSSIPAHGVMLLELSGTTAAGLYTSPVKSGTTFKFSNVYGLTTSTLFSGLLAFTAKSTTARTITITTSASTSKTVTIPANTISLSIPLSLSSSPTNTITITSTTLIPTSLTLTNPPASFFPSTKFTISGTADFVTCTTGLCQPVGIKIGNIAPTGSATISIPRTPALTSATTTVTKYLEVYFINNDIAIATSFTTGTNTRNLTLQLNSNAPVRIEVPLSGRSSELFSPMLGWGDTSVFNISMDGFGVGTGSDVLILSNIGGDSGVQMFGPDFVGLGVVG